MSKNKRARCLGEELPVIVDALTESGLRKILAIADDIEKKELERIMDKYGGDNNERRTAIRLHLIGCRRCREGYLLYLDRKAGKAVDWAGNAGDEGKAKFADLILNAGYREVVEAYDAVRLLPHLK